MIKATVTGSTNKTEAMLKRAAAFNPTALLNQYGRQGVAALAAATPTETGETSRSWSYEIVRDNGKISVVWTNSHVENGQPIAILLQYGHATRTGGYVQGRDYINPAMQPIFDRMAENLWKVVTRL